MKYLNYEHYFSEKKEDIAAVEDYHSHNTHRLDVEGVEKLLKTLEVIQEDLKVTPSRTE